MSTQLHNLRPTWNAVVTCYNYGKSLERAVDSILSQSCSSLIVTIVNDKSNDNTSEVCGILQEKDDRILIIENQTNIGVAKSRNLGIEAIRSKFLVILDADDWLGPDYLLEAERTFEETGCDIICPSIMVIRDGMESKFMSETKFSFNDYTRYCRTPVSCPMRYDVWESVGGFKSRSIHEDYDFWLDVSKNQPVFKKMNRVIFVIQHVGSRSDISEDANRRSWSALARYHKVPLIQGVGPFDVLDREELLLCNYNEEIKIRKLIM